MVGKPCRDGRQLPQQRAGVGANAEWTRDIALVKPYMAPVVVDEVTQRLDQITTSIGVMTVRCVDEAPPTQPVDAAVDTSPHAP